MRGPLTDWKRIRADQFGPFELTLQDVKKALEDDVAFKLVNFEDIQLNLVGGGIIARNQAIMEGDKLVATPFLPGERLKKRKEKEEKKKKKKKPRGYIPKQMVKTDIAAYDPTLSFNEAEFHMNPDIAKDLVNIKGLCLVGNASQPTARQQV